MQSYTKTNWVVDVTKVNPTNMNKIENQLETLTNEFITPTHTHSQYLTQHQDITGKLDTSKVKNANSTTAGDTYDVRYINGLIGDINTVLASLTTVSSGGGS